MTKLDDARGFAWMVFVLVALILTLLVGCVSKRDQAIADSAATIHEAAQAQTDGVALAPTVEAIQSNAKAIETATGAVGVPAATARVWHEDLPKAATAAGNQAKTTAATAAWGFVIWSGIFTGALTVLAVAKRVVPLIPGVGPLWGTVVDGLYWVAQHKNAKEADKATMRVASAVSVGLPAIREFRELSPDAWLKLPDAVRTALENIQKTG